MLPAHIVVYNVSDAAAASAVVPVLPQIAAVPYL
jgi:hypothetical protein